MQAVITDGKGNVKLENIEMPRPAPWQCLCRIDACATCSGTDQKLVNSGFDWAKEYPAILGHEGVGTVIECGKDVKNFKVGQRILRPAVALPGTMYGEFASWMGGFAEYGLITDIAAAEGEKSQLDPFGYTRYQQTLPDDLEISQRDATLLVMLKEVAGACKGAGISAGDHVLVLGGGAVTQAMCFFSSLYGASVTVAARRDEQLDRCLKCGASVAVNLLKDSLEDAVMSASSGHGADKVMDAAGNVELAVRAANMLADGGGMASYATVEGGRFPEEQVRARGKWQMLSNAVPECGMHEEIIEMIRKKTVVPEMFYTDVMEFEKFEAGFPLLAAKKAGKIVFEMH